MNHTTQQLMADLNHDVLQKRLDALAALMDLEKKGQIQLTPQGNDVNNHIHTWYSFSPYSPTKAVFMARQAGLSTAGIMDHDSVAGLEEFRRAGEIAGIATTGGVECRVCLPNSPFGQRRINNPDQDGVAYIALHGIPLTQVQKVDAFLAPLRERRNQRSKRMTQRLDGLFAQHGIGLDFEQDVLPLSRYHQGGGVTERHILFALAHKIIDKIGLGDPLVAFISQTLGLSLSPRVTQWLASGDAYNTPYDVLGVLKSSLVEQFYLDADTECPPIEAVIELAKQVGAVSAYAYLGDVGDSVTGDKKPQQFEDAYLDELVEYLGQIGFNAITYMPSRNTSAQLDRIKQLCQQQNLFEISGEDINSPRQVFICHAARADEFANLVESAWALIGHEHQAELDSCLGMFSPQTIELTPGLEQRIAQFAQIGRRQAAKAPCTLAQENR